MYTTTKKIINIFGGRSVTSKKSISAPPDLIQSMIHVRKSTATKPISQIHDFFTNPHTHQTTYYSIAKKKSSCDPHLLTHVRTNTK